MNSGESIVEGPQKDRVKTRIVETSIEDFDAIAQAGAGDPAAVASGISEALITTASGLIVAIPTIVFHRYLSARADRAYKEIELYCHAFANTLVVRFGAKREE